MLCRDGVRQEISLAEEWRLSSLSNEFVAFWEELRFINIQFNRKQIDNAIVEFVLDGVVRGMAMFIFRGVQIVVSRIIVGRVDGAAVSHFRLLVVSIFIA